MAGPISAPLTASVRQGLRQRVDAAVVMAEEASRLLVDYWSTLRGRFERKGPVDLVTEADRGSERLLLERIAEAFPLDEVLTEETGMHAGTGDFRWCLDPLDGTTNFVHGQSAFAVSIGIAFQDQWHGAAVVLPARGEGYWAMTGEGAWGPGGERLQVSPTRALMDSLIATGFPYRRAELVEDLLDDWRRLTGHCHGVRCSGAAVVDLVGVASGRLEGYFERELAPWDTAAGAVLVREAGGLVTRFDGTEFSPFVGEVVATNPWVSEALRHRLFSNRRHGS